MSEKLCLQQKKDLIQEKKETEQTKPIKKDVDLPKKLATPTWI